MLVEELDDEEDLGDIFFFFIIFGDELGKIFDRVSRCIFLCSGVYLLILLGVLFSSFLGVVGREGMFFGFFLLFNFFIDIGFVFEDFKL